MNWEERVEMSKKKVAERMAKSKGGLSDKTVLTSELRDAANKTIGLLSYPEFKEYQKLESGNIAKFLANPFKNMPGTDGMSYAEKMAFNNGYHRGMMEFKSFIETLWIKISTEDRNESKS